MGFLPSNGILVQDVQNAWNGLEESEKGYEEWLLSEMRRLERLDHLAKKFYHKAKIHESWTAGKVDMLEDDDYKSCSLQELLALMKKHEAFESDLAAHQDRVEQIVNIAQELYELEHHDSLKIKERCDKICVEWSSLGDATQKRRLNLETMVQILESIEAQHLEFAKRAAPFNNWMDGAMEDLEDMFIVHTMEAVRDLKTAHENFKQTLPDAQVEMEKIMTILNDINRVQVQYSLQDDVLVNPYSSINADELQGKWKRVLELVPLRDQSLHTEENKQENHERLRIQFSQLANQIGPWIKEKNWGNRQCRHGPQRYVRERREPIERVRSEFGELQTEDG